MGTGLSPKRENACNTACADACFMAQESRISCSTPSPVQTLLRDTCRMSLETLQCAAVAAATIITEHKKKRYRKRWMAGFLERRNRNLNLLGEVRTDSCALFRNFTRVTGSDFELLLQMIGPSIKNQDTDMREAIPISTRLDVTLRVLATGDSCHILLYTGCPRRNVPDFGRVFLMLKYTDITQNTYVQS